MSKKKESKLPAGKLLLGLMFATMVLYIGGSLLSLANQKIRTEQVVEDTIYDFVRAECVAFRDEELINKTADGIVVYNYADGEEIGHEESVASVYKNQATALAKNQLEELQNELDNLRKVQLISSTNIAGNRNLSNQINEQVGKLQDIAASGVVEGMSSERDELVMLLNRKQVAIGNADPFTERITYLEAQISALQSSNQEMGTAIQTPSQGYFYKTIDGYESIFTFDAMKELSYDSFTALAAQAPLSTGNNVLGKVIKTHLWYVGVALDEKETQKFAVGDTVKLDFKFANEQPVPATVKQIIQDQEKEHAIVLFQCKSITDRLLSVRKQSVDIVFTTYSGMRVSSKALYYEQNVPGVYVLDKTTIHFKPVNVIKDNETYLLCEPDASADKEHRLKLLDSIIIESGGIPLRDGKQLQEGTVEGVESTNGVT